MLFYWPTSQSACGNTQNVSFTVKIFAYRMETPAARSGPRVQRDPGGRLTSLRRR